MSTYFPLFEDYLKQFRLFIQSIENEGVLIFNESDEEVEKLAKETRIEKIGYQQHGARTNANKTTLLASTGEKIPIKIFGAHNMLNINAAKAVCLQMGVDETIFYQAISSFKGASRRLELLYEKPELLFTVILHMRLLRLKPPAWLCVINMLTTSFCFVLSCTLLVV